LEKKAGSKRRTTRKSREARNQEAGKQAKEKPKVSGGPGKLEQGCIEGKPAKTRANAKVQIKGQRKKG